MYYQSHNRNQMITKFYNSRFNNVEDSFSILKLRPLKKHRKFHKCQINCRKHRFSLRKKFSEYKQQNIFKKIEDVDLTFCPNQFFGIVSGGFPVFNFDGKSDTPAFQAKYELNNTSANFLYSQKFMKRKQKIEKQNSIAEHNPNIEFSMSQSVYSKIFSGHVISQFQEILRQKNKVQVIKLQ